MITTIRKLVSQPSRGRNVPALSLEATIYLAAAIFVAGFGCYKAVTAATYLEAIKWSQAVSIVSQVILVWLVARLTGKRARGFLLLITCANAGAFLAHVSSMSGLFLSEIRDLYLLPLPTEQATPYFYISRDLWRTLIELSNAVVFVWMSFALWFQYRRGERSRVLVTATIAYIVLAANLYDMFFVRSIFLAPYGLLLMLIASWYVLSATKPPGDIDAGAVPTVEAAEPDTASRPHPTTRQSMSRFLPSDQNPLVGAALAMLLVSAAQWSKSELLESTVVLLVLIGMMQATIKTLYRVGSSRWLRELALVALCVLGLSQVVNILHGLDTFSFPFLLEAQGLLQPQVRNWLWVLGLLLLLSAFYLAGVEAGESRKALLSEHGQLVTEVAERKLMAKRLALVKEAEQQRIRHDLHDTVGQDLAGLLCMAGGLSRKLKEVSEDSSKNAEAIEEGVRQTIEDVRKAIRGIAPIDADPKGLEVALVELVAKTNSQHEIEVHFDCDTPTPIIDYGTATQLYRIAQEALTNAVKHSHAQSINISLLSDSQKVVLAITDDGIGIDSQKTLGPGMGLRTMRFRAEDIGAMLSISENEQGNGTRIECVLRKQAISTAQANKGGSKNHEI